MKRILFILLIAGISTGLSAQVSPDKYYVQFTDKNNSPYSISNPGEFLSQRAIDRRTLHDIPLDERDLPVNPQYIDGVAATGAEILNPTKWFNGVTVFTDDPAVIDAVNALPYVASVRSVVNYNAPAIEKPFFVNEKTGLPAVTGKQQKAVSVFDYGDGFNQIEMLNGHQLHEMGYRGEGMVIAVLDAGFLATDQHPAFDSLWANGQILDTRDFVDGGEVTFSTHSHGTMVLSCMGALDPGELVGTAPKASYLLLRSEDGDSEYIIEEYNWVSAAEFADSAGADVINSSLGYTVFNDPLQSHVYTDMDGNTTPITIGADLAASRGLIVVNSAGNEGSSPWYFLSAPSDGDSVFGIGAVDSQGNYVSFSGHGPSADGRVKPNVVAQGSGAWVAEPWAMMYTGAGGTSFSSPITAGMMACLWQANPAMNNMQLMAAVEQSASQYASPDDELGYGIPDFMLANNILTVIDQEELPEHSLRILAYPNPFTDRLRVSVSGLEGSQGRIELVDILGQVVFESLVTGNRETAFDLSALHHGIYLLRITHQDQSRLVKVVKR